jgi:uncharacterized protein (DUF1499 family)
MTHRASHAVLALAGSLLLAACHGARPAALGVRDGRLAPCPANPNCVSSQEPGADKRVEPLPFSGPATAAMQRLAAIVRSLPRATVVSATGSYLHAEFRSAVFRFVDDVEFLADEAAGVVHVRSASRLGSSDFGVNRRRVEAIRARWREPRQ